MISWDPQEHLTLPSEITMIWMKSLTHTWTSGLKITKPYSQNYLQSGHNQPPGGNSTRPTHAKWNHSTLHYSSNRAYSVIVTGHHLVQRSWKAVAIRFCVVKVWKQGNIVFKVHDNGTVLCIMLSPDHRSPGSLTWLRGLLQVRFQFLLFHWCGHFEFSSRWFSLRRMQGILFILLGVGFIQVRIR